MATRRAAAVRGVYVDLDGLIALSHRARGVSFLPRQPVHSLLSGRYASRMRGRGLNFEEIRAYLPGDDVRSIEWKVTARMRRPHVRVFNEERDREGLLVVDQRLAMFYGTRLAMKSVTAAEVAALGAWRVLAAGDRVGGVVFNDREIVEVPARRSRSTVLRLLGAIVRQNQALGVGQGIVPQSNMLNRALERVAQRVPHDSVVVIVSDFDGADGDTRRLVGAMAQHNDVIAALIHDPSQSELVDSGHLVVSDGELQVELDLGRESVRRSMIEMSHDRLRDVFAWTRDFGVPVVPVSAAEDAADQVRRLLGRAAARRRPERSAVA
jgi:uncharacterized protein (DUF58 family)